MSRYNSPCQPIYTRDSCGCPPDRRYSPKDDICEIAQRCINGKTLQTWMRADDVLEVYYDTPTKTAHVAIVPGEDGQVLGTVKQGHSYIVKWVDAGSEGTLDHASLENLDYKNSGHTGFASSEQLAAVQAVAQAAQVTAEAAKTAADKAVPQTRTVNGKALSSDITLTADDISGLDGKYQEKLTAGQNITITDGNVISASLDSYIYNQGTAASTWVISHGLSRFPSVTIVDSAGNKVQGDVQYIDGNSIIARFESAFAGKAYLN